MEEPKKNASLLYKTHNEFGNAIDKMVDPNEIKVEPLTIDEITLKLRDFLMNLVSQGRPVAFETIINVLMNTYVSMLFNFQSKKDVIPTIRQHTEMVIEQILAAKMHEEEDEYTAKPSPERTIIIPTD